MVLTMTEITNAMNEVVNEIRTGTNEMATCRESIASAAARFAAMTAKYGPALAALETKAAANTGLAGELALFNEYKDEFLAKKTDADAMKAALDAV